jgi:hypothetical protein
MNFLRIADGTYVNTLNILKFEVSADAVMVYLVGQPKPVALVQNDAATTTRWLEWIAKNAVNVS